MRYLALDVGDERIGVAVSDAEGRLARPLEVLRRGQGTASFRRIAELVCTYDARAIVVGWPILPDGSEGRQVRSTAAYINGLRKHVQVPVIRWDERDTTHAAREILACEGRISPRARRRLDAVAAAVILQSYLDEQQGGRA